MKHNFTVEGMKCGGCSANVEKALVGLDGLELIEIDLEQKSVVISGDIDPAVAAQIISDSGYPATPA